MLSHSHLVPGFPPTHSGLRESLDGDNDTINLRDEPLLQKGLEWDVMCFSFHSVPHHLTSARFLRLSEEERFRISCHLPLVPISRSHRPLASLP